MNEPHLDRRHRPIVPIRTQVRQLVAHNITRDPADLLLKHPTSSVSRRPSRLVRIATMTGRPAPTVAT